MDILDIIFEIQEAKFKKHNKETKANHIIKFVEDNCECGEFYKVSDLYNSYVNTYGYTTKPWFMEVINDNYKMYTVKYKKHIRGGERKNVDFDAIRG